MKGLKASMETWWENLVSCNYKAEIAENQMQNLIFQLSE